MYTVCCLVSTVDLNRYIQTKYDNNVHIIRMYVHIQRYIRMYFHDSDEALQNSLSVIFTLCVQDIQEHIHNSVCTAYM